MEASTFENYTAIKEFCEEEERMKLRILQADAGLIGSKDLLVTAERMDWMYHNPVHSKQAQEDYLLGKPLQEVDEREETRKRLGVGTLASGSLFLPSLTSKNDNTLRLLSEDPLLVIRQAEYRQRLMNSARDKILTLVKQPYGDRNLEECLHSKRKKDNTGLKKGSHLLETTESYQSTDKVTSQFVFKKKPSSPVLRSSAVLSHRDNRFQKARHAHTNTYRGPSACHERSLPIRNRDTTPSATSKSYTSDSISPPTHSSRSRHRHSKSTYSKSQVYFHNHRRGRTQYSSIHDSSSDSYGFYSKRKASPYKGHNTSSKENSLLKRDLSRSKSHKISSKRCLSVLGNNTTLSSQSRFRSKYETATRTPSPLSSREYSCLSRERSVGSISDHNVHGVSPLSKNCKLSYIVKENHVDTRGEKRFRHHITRRKSSLPRNKREQTENIIPRSSCFSSTSRSVSKRKNRRQSPNKVVQRNMYQSQRDLNKFNLDSKKNSDYFSSHSPDYKTRIEFLHKRTYGVKSPQKSKYRHSRNYHRMNTSCGSDRSGLKRSKRHGLVDVRNLSDASSNMKSGGHNNDLTSDREKDQSVSALENSNFLRKAKVQGPVCPLEWRNQLESYNQESKNLIKNSTEDFESDAHSTSLCDSDDDLGPPASLVESITNFREKKNEISSVWKSQKGRFVTPINLKQTTKNFPPAKQNLESSITLSEEDKKKELQRMMNEGQRHEEEKKVKLQTIDAIDSLREQKFHSERIQSWISNTTQPFQENILKQACLNESSSLEQRLKRYASRRQKTLLNLGELEDEMK